MTPRLLHRLASMALVIGLSLTVACASSRSKFLQRETPGWNQWLDTVVDVSIIRVPLSDVFQRPPFDKMKVVLKDVDGSTAISFEEDRITRREALYRMAEKYGLVMIATRDIVLVTNRESSRDMRPLP